MTLAKFEDLSEMVELVARAIGEALTEADMVAGWGYITEQERLAIARAAIAAMRVPSDVMIKAITVTPWGEDNNREAILRDWGKMIDAALADAPEVGAVR